MKHYQFYLLLTGTLLINSQCLGIRSYELGDILFVLAPKGIELRDTINKLNVKSQILTTIPFGAKVIIKSTKTIGEGMFGGDEEFEEISGRWEDEKEIHGFSLRGNWAVIQYKEWKGYVPDCYLSKLRPLNSGESFIEYAKKEFKLENNIISIKKDIQELYKIIFNNGLLIDVTQNCGEGYGGCEFYFCPFSFEEAYFFFVNADQMKYYGQDDDLFFFREELGELTLERDFNTTIVKHCWGN